MALVWWGLALAPLLIGALWFAWRSNALVPERRLIVLGTAILTGLIVAWFFASRLSTTDAEFWIALVLTILTVASMCVGATALHLRTIDRMKPDGRRAMLSFSEELKHVPLLRSMLLPLDELRREE